MKFGIKVFLAWAVVTSSALAVEKVLEASKDTFMRSNGRTKNNGASNRLVVTHVSHIKSLIAFDFSEVTNQITGATFRFKPQNENANPITVIIAPMVYTDNNAEWGEGFGNLGNVGQNARIGEACVARSAYRDVHWESSGGAPLQSILSAGLWKSPIATLNQIEWSPDKWIEVPIKNVALLEEIRGKSVKTVTFGLWGSSGKGVYFIKSKESSHPPELVLEIKEDKK